MTVFGTGMHIVTFIVVCIQFLIFFFQSIYTLERPNDKQRIYFLILLFLYLIYNICAGLFIDENLKSVSINTQITLAYGTGFILAAYFPIYLYLAYNLTALKFHIRYGIILFFILPFLITTGILYFFSLKQYAYQVVQYSMIIPGIYALILLYVTVKAIWDKYKKEKNISLFFFFLAIAPWVSMPIISYYTISQLYETIIMNTGFIAFVVLYYIRKSILAKRHEHKQYLQEKFLTEQAFSKKESELLARQLRERQYYQEIIHEARTPLTLLNNYIDSLEEHPQNLQIVRNTVHKLTRDINSLYEIERIGIEKYLNQKPSTTLNLSHIVVEFVELMQQYLITKKLTISVSVTENILVKSDLYSIHRILYNLIENAIKFSFEGGEIQVSLTISDNGKSCLSIRDFGQGMKASKKKQILTPFAKIENHSGGLGLGLKLVKKIVYQKLSGTLSIISSPEIVPGTKIKVCLPVSTDENNISAITKNCLKELNGNIPKTSLSNIEIQHRIQKSAKHNILLVENNFNLLNYLATKLSTPERNIYLSNECESAIKLIAEIPIHFIISDIDFSRMNGIEFLKTIKKMEKGKSIPFIFITGINNQFKEPHLHSLGALRVFYKPFSIKTINAQINSILSLIQNPAEDIIIRQKNTEQADGGNDLKVLLSKRELEIFDLLLTEKTNQQIADALYISVRTVTTHINNIYRKLDISSRLEIITKFKKNISLD